MSMIKNMVTWLDSIKTPAWVDFIRIGLGLFIVYKGLVFTFNFEVFTQNMVSIGWIFIAAHVAQYILFIHLVGGALLAMGAHTRSMSFLNIPILAGAVVFNYKQFLTAENHMELPAALVVLSLLLLTFFYGSGKYSVDAIRKRREALRGSLGSG